MIQKAYVQKSTATPADNLLAFGLSQLIFNLQQNKNSLQITDTGDSHQIYLSQPIQESWISEAEFFVLFKGLDTGKKRPDLPPFQIEDYLKYQQNNRVYFESRKAGLDENTLREQGITPPALDWPVWAVINQMSAADTFNKLTEIWYAHRKCFPSLLMIILKLYGTRPNPLHEAEQDWKELAKIHGIESSSQIPQLQVVNPGMGKGGNRAKADGLGIGGLKGFWIPEYLKFAGLFQCGIPRTVSGSKDRKTYVLRPKALNWETHHDIFPKFQESLYASSAVKMDILADLRYCEVFLTQWKASQEDGWAKFVRTGNPGDHVAALDVIFYKHLGSAHATLNISTLVLPEWIPAVETKDQADQFLAILLEHRDIIRGLDEKHGDEYELLRRYRKFLSGRDIEAFYDFSAGYSRYVMHKLIAGGYPPRQFTIPNLEVLIMAHDSKLAPILENDGFLHIAEAIRRSTVLPQYQKSRGRDLLYEIRYGLGDKLRRNAQYPDEFIQDLSGFIHEYNRENARKSETRRQQFRSNITTQDINNLVQLIDQYGSPTIASLLVAYGYARDPKIAEERISEQAASEREEEMESGAAE